MTASYTVAEDFTAPQRELHDELLRFEQNALIQLHGNARSISFMMTTIKRQAASCIFGLALMGLNFEGHQTVRYPFDESNVLVDVNSFYKELDEIAIERNKKFLYKTEAEIAEMQEAVEYLNTLLDSDLIKIKEYVFPGLWRFGIGLTQSNQFEITHYSRELKKETVYRPDETNMFCLYPQYKGKLDLPVGEFK